MALRFSTKLSKHEAFEKASAPLSVSDRTAPARGCEVRPLPFGEPVSAAFAVALKLHHASAALRTDQIYDRRNDAGATFTGKCLELCHSFAP